MNNRNLTDKFNGQCYSWWGQKPNRDWEEGTQIILVTLNLTGNKLILPNRCIIKYEKSWFCLDVINNDMHGGTKNLVEIGKNEFKSYWWHLHISLGYVVYAITVWKWDYDWEMRLGLGCEIMVGLCDNGWRVRIRFGGDLELRMIGTTTKSVIQKPNGFIRLICML